jgi:hypothetical protein
MIRVPIEYEPTNLLPCLTTRIRKEGKIMDSINSKYVDHRSTDVPIVYGKDAKGTDRSTYFDMNPTATRLYREDMRQSQPYVSPSESSDLIKEQLQMKRLIDSTLASIQKVQNAIQAKEGEGYDLEGALKDLQDYYQTLLIRQKQQGIDAIARNPYFEKYDIATDSRNIVRELRSAVSEDVVNRGEKESERLLRREMENRWLPINFAESKGIDQLSAYELMRPSFNNMDTTYR